MKINQNNYEQYFIDYLDGNLDPHLIPEFMAFLAQNPKLADELYEIEDNQGVACQPETVTFHYKESLKKNQDSQTDAILQDFEELCIAKMEGDLNNKQSSGFNIMIRNNPVKGKIYHRFTQTILKPDYNVVFPGKYILKKSITKELTIRTIIPYAAIAALFVLIFSIYFLLKEKSGIKPVNMASTGQTEKHITGMSQGSNDTIIRLTESSIKKDNNIENINQGKNQKEEIIIPVSLSALDNGRIEVSPNENQTSQAGKPEFRKYTPVDVSLNSAEVIMLADNSSTPENNGNEYLTVGQYIQKLFKNKLLRKENEEKIDVWKIAGTGVKEIGKLTGTDMVLTRQCLDSECKVVKYALNTGGFEFSTRRNK